MGKLLGKILGDLSKINVCIVGLYVIKKGSVEVRPECYYFLVTLGQNETKSTSAAHLFLLRVLINKNSR